MTGPATYASPILTTTPSLEREIQQAITSKQEPEQPLVRHFNTSRSLRAVGDTSTIDFAYLPSADIVAPSEQLSEFFRVPILPSTTTPSPSIELPSASDEDVVVMKPEISSMSADAVFLPMSEFTDGHAMNIDFHAMADRVQAGLKRVKEQVSVEEQASMMKRIWGDMVDDMLAAAAGKKAG